MGYLQNIGRALMGRYSAASPGYAGATRGRRMMNVAATYQGVNSLALTDGPLLTARTLAYTR